jgi:hypothetical protein
MMIGAAVVLLAGSSASDARWLRGGDSCCYSAVDSTANAAASPSAAPTTTAVAPATSGPVVYQAYKPVNVAEPRLVVPPPANYAPNARSGGASVLPRSAWEYGRFPPFR